MTLEPFEITHSLTHSLVDLPRWGLATADDHSDIFLLHCAWSCDVSFSGMYLQPVHSSMSCIHCFLGLPWCRNPSMIPSRTASANCPALPRECGQNIVVSALPLFPGPILLILNHLYGVLAMKCKPFYSSTTFQKLLFCFCPISSKSIPPLHTLILPTPLTSSPLWRNRTETE